MLHYISCLSRGVWHIVGAHQICVDCTVKIPGSVGSNWKLKQARGVRKWGPSDWDILGELAWNSARGCRQDLQKKMLEVSEKNRGRFRGFWAMWNLGR